MSPNPTLNSVVDSLLELNGVIRSCGMSHIRVQEKATRSALRQIKLSKAGGALGRLAYAKEDFDLLAACILVDSHLHGLFLIPMPVLVEHGFVGNRAATMTLFPSWSPPTRSPTRLKYAWQPDYFVDLRDWQGSSDCAAGVKDRLKTLIQTATTAVGGKSHVIDGT